MDHRGVYMAGSQDAGHPYYATLFPEGKTAPDLQAFEFPSQDGATVGGQVAFQWISVQLIQRGDSITWSMNGIDVVKASQSDASSMKGMSFWATAIGLPPFQITENS